ncbi:MAG: penicillin-binding protein 2 [Treponema sp. CETP13]|nr:MAG: penicillin-binding protein 2 [Treponema sp. CETP13]
MAGVIHSSDLKNKSGSSLSKNKSIFVFLILIFLVFIIYVAKLFSMQVIEGSQYRTQSKNLAQQQSIIPAQRGEIFNSDSDMAIVVNTDSFAVDVTPGEIPDEHYDSITARLAIYLHINKKVIDDKIPIYSRSSYKAFEIKSNVSFDEISNIAENITDLPGVSWRSKPIRNYLLTGSMSHVVGYVGAITKDELKVLYNQGYDSTSIIGKTGIEKEYDKQLQGTPGVESRIVDVRGRFMSDKPVVDPPVSGNDIVLTIDTSIQKLAEEALGDRVGSAIVLKPSTGEILAMVSYPYFNPNLFNEENSSSKFQALLNDPKKPLLNRTINATYPPASTFKVIMATALLQEKTFDKDSKVECKGSIDYGGRVFHCWTPFPGHGFMDLKNGLAQSCNIYFWTIGRDYLGVDLISKYAKMFGYGGSLGIDLPSSKTGFIPTAEWKERRYHEKWLGGDTMSMSIGQGYTNVTPLHVADMMAMVVNSGTIYKPHLLKQIRNGVTNEIIKKTEPEVLYRADSIDSDVWKTVQEDLRYTVTDGSAWYPLQNDVVKFAGKTGTAEVTGYKDSWHSWFVAYGPYDAPVEDQLVVCVMVEAQNPWEWWAPYASNIIFQGIFANENCDEAIDSLRKTGVWFQKPVGREE